jgi:predicted membrane-bound spermidine synthase
MFVSFFQKYGSYFYPITIEVFENKEHKQLQIELYKNEYMLTTPNVYYSKGTTYMPCTIAFKKLTFFLPAVKSMLVLGTGLGSALKILQEKYNVFPICELVEIDDPIIQRSKKYMQLNSRKNVTWICMNAIDYMQLNSKKVDLIFVDIFDDMHVPYETFATEFLTNCKNSLSAKGYCVFNYLFENEHQKNSVHYKLQVLFTTIDVLKHKNNLIYICTNQ